MPLGLRAELQVTGESLLCRGTARCFHLKPDIGIYRGRQLLALIDTKWKRLDPHATNHGVAQSDIYQAYAYGKEYNAPLVVLLYPDNNRTSWPLVHYHHPSAPHELQIATIPLPGNVTQSLAAAISHCVSDSKTFASVAQS